MSWKSLVSAGLLCVLASPAFAAPTLTVTNQGLNTAGNWVWRVQIAPSNPIPTGSSPLAAELGFRETAALAELLAATNLSTGAGDDFDTNNPGSVIFGWETLTDVDPGAGVNMKPVGVQTNTGTDEVFAALGSQLYSTTGGKDFIDIEVSRPVATSATDDPAKRTTSLQWLGAYGGNGRIAEYNPTPPPDTINHDTYSGTVSRTATAGDTNLAGGVGLQDFNDVLGNLGTGTTWQQGNFDNVGTTGLADFNTVLGALGQPSGGAGSGGGSAVPEPATVALFALGLINILGLVSRRRK